MAMLSKAVVRWRIQAGHSRSGPLSLLLTVLLSAVAPRPRPGGQSPAEDQPGRGPEAQAEGLKY
jgi:hypothetical protein